MCEKEFADSNFKLKSYWQNIDFSSNCPKFHIFTKIVIFFKYNCNVLDQLLVPYKFHGSSMRGILFFNFASSEPLTFVYGLPMIERRHFTSWILGSRKEDDFITRGCGLVPMIMMIVTTGDSRDPCVVAFCVDSINI